ncbi:nadh-ubiquinone oxidoreductase 12 kda subunit [Pyrrhoderma noxium]|uniref:Nadh-ubiquinone oxidoreductase 12 kDa subunit n=1 Tax=Pyrrhoderma noxium TaxID=2282107 RepID=A0A286UAJ1_9AGAM|nr:nadh-ubiquinone oxidoreductase 12 kda subunit [Pyrrhoderma noxium]
MDSDVVAQLQARVAARDEHIRESWVRAMEAKLVRDELNKCQRAEGVNHYENCKYLSERYIEMLRENKVKGYKHIDT